MADAAMTIILDIAIGDDGTESDREFAFALHRAGMPASSFATRMMPRSVALTDYVVPMVQVIVPALGGVLVGWLQGRAGRKVRVKLGDAEAEARTIEDVERLLKLVADYKAKTVSDTTGPIRNLV